MFLDQVKQAERAPSPKEGVELDDIEDLEAELQRRMEERRLQWHREWARDQVGILTYYISIL